MVDIIALYREKAEPVIQKYRSLVTDTQISRKERRREDTLKSVHPQLNDTLVDLFYALVKQHNVELTKEIREQFKAEGKRVLGLLSKKG